MIEAYFQGELFTTSEKYFFPLTLLYMYMSL